MDYLHGWYNETLIKSKSAQAVEGIPTVPKERIYMFRGEDRVDGTPETSTEEINEFIMRNIPRREDATETKNFSYA